MLTTSFLSQFNKQWNNVCRRKDAFVSKYGTYLEKYFVAELMDHSSSNTIVQSHAIDGPANVPTTSKRGRPRSCYEEGSAKTKSRRINDIASKYSEEELLRALKKKQCGKEFDSEEAVIEEGVTDEENNRKLNQTLAMYMDLDLTKEKYKNFRSHNVDIHGDQLYPSYDIIAKAKKSCFPEHINISESGASVDLISLLEHTTKRILLTFDNEKLERCNNELTLIEKWGMDGASGQQTTRQNWTAQTTSVKQKSMDDDANVSHENLTDKAVFFISFVPLQLKAANEIMWQNDKHSSTFYCRPIEFKFCSETREVVKEYYELYSKLLEKVQMYCFTLKDKTFTVTFDLKCTMIDGKVCNVLTDQRKEKEHLCQRQ